MFKKQSVPDGDAVSIIAVRTDIRDIFIVFTSISQKQQNHIRKDGRNTHFLSYQCGIIRFSA